MNRRHGQSPVVGHVYMLRMMRQQRGSPASSEGSDRTGWARIRKKNERG